MAKDVIRVPSRIVSVDGQKGDLLESRANIINFDQFRLFSCWSLANFEYIYFLDIGGMLMDDSSMLKL